LDDLEEIHININANEIRSKFGNEELNVNFNEAVYIKNSKKYDAREEEEKYGEDDVLPNDYIEPRLFIVNNDNTGFELINQKMYQSYLKEHEETIDKVYEKKNSKSTECHILGKEEKHKGKFIKNNLLVDLDVFDNTNSENSKPTHSYISLKTLLRYEPLTAESVGELQKIRVDM
jgi:hypothetical protein